MKKYRCRFADACLNGTSSDPNYVNDVAYVLRVCHHARPHIIHETHSCICERNHACGHYRDMDMDQLMCHTVEEWEL